MNTAWKYWVVAIALMVWLVLAWLAGPWLNLQGNDVLDPSRRTGADRLWLLSSPPCGGSKESMMTVRRKWRKKRRPTAMRSTS